MQSFFWFILNSPPIHEKLVKEIDEAALGGKLSDMITYNEAQSLPYFQASLKEAMRLRPAVGLNISRLVPEGGAIIDGTWYPGGTAVAFNGWVVHRDQGVFGQDAEEYRPGRWLEEAEKVKVMERHMYQVSLPNPRKVNMKILKLVQQFGGGSRLCIGRNLALLEINKILPLLLRTYSFKLVNPGEPLKHNTTFFVTQKGLNVYIKKRVQK